MNELVSIMQKGSWYEVAWRDKKTLCTNQVQGYKQLVRFIRYACIKHTTGTPLVNDIRVNDLISMITVDGSLTDNEQWNIINQRLNSYLSETVFTY